MVKVSALRGDSTLQGQCLVDGQYCIMLLLGIIWQYIDLQCCKTEDIYFDDFFFDCVPYRIYMMGKITNLTIDLSNWYWLT